MSEAIMKRFAQYIKSRRKFASKSNKNQQNTKSKSKSIRLKVKQAAGGKWFSSNVNYRKLILCRSLTLVPGVVFSGSLCGLERCVRV